MRRTRRRTVEAGLGLVLGLGPWAARDVLGQAPAPPEAVQAPAAPADLNSLSQRMAEQVRFLGEDVAAEMGQTPGGAHLIQDVNELAQSVDEFRATLNGRQDPGQMRQAYGGIDGTWHHLRAALTKPGGSTPAVERAARRVDQIDAQLHQALDLNTPPAEFFGQAPPVGLPETRRLAHALVDRADALAAAVQTQMGRDPAAADILRDTDGLYKDADAFHDALDRNPAPETLPDAFRPVADRAERLRRELTGGAVPAPVRNAWLAFSATEVLIRQNLNMGTQAAPDRPAPDRPSPVVALADQLVQQTDDFVRVFGPTAGRVPQGPYMLADGQRLLADAQNFRDDVSKGLDAGRLAYEFRDVDADWQRLSRRVNRIAQGRTGPNIRQVQAMGETCAQLHQYLGMPGQPPVILNPAPADDR